MAKAEGFKPKDPPRVKRLLQDFEHNPRTRTYRSGGPLESSRRSTHFQNSASASDACPAYGVLCVSDAETLAVGFEVVTGDKPSTTFRRSFILNGPLEVVGQEYGLVQEGAALHAAYDSGTPANDEVWGPKPGQWTLSLGYPGFICLGIVDATNKIMFAKPEANPVYHGKADSAISKGSTGTVSLWVGASGSEIDSTINITGCRARGAAITSGKIVTVVFMNGVPYVLPWEC